MTSVDDLWYLSDEADQRAERAYHSLSERYDDYLTFETTKHVSRERFRTVAHRIRSNGAPYGAHTLAYRERGELLLVRHDPIDKWVLPGGEATDDESFREAAERELREEASVEADYGGIGLLGLVTFRAGDHTTWGIIPMFEGDVRANQPRPQPDDPDGEITDAQWFTDLPGDTRDRERLLRWRRKRFG